MFPKREGIHRNRIPRPHVARLIHGLHSQTRGLGARLQGESEQSKNTEDGAKMHETKLRLRCQNGAIAMALFIRF